MIRFALTTLALLVATSAAASPLGDGKFKGVPFGPSSVLDGAPHESCSPSDEADVTWSCQTTVGGQKATVAYMAAEGHFYSTFSTIEGYEACQGLLRTLESAWGEGTKDNPYIDKWSWGERGILGVLDYNKYRKACTLIVMSSVEYKAAEAAKKAKAAQSTGDL